jgi:hypothetical protein
MWPFRKRPKEIKRHRVVRRVVVGFIIGGAISSIVGNHVLKERRRQHLGEDKAE